MNVSLKNSRQRNVVFYHVYIYIYLYVPSATTRIKYIYSCNNYEEEDVFNRTLDSSGNFENN